VKVSLNFISRIIGMLVLAYIGSSIGQALSNPNPDESQILATRLLMFAGAGLGLLTTHRFTVEPMQEILRRIRVIPLSEIFLILFGAIVGLLIGVLLAVPLSYLPPPFSQYLPLISALFLAYLGGLVCSIRKRDITEFLLHYRNTTRSLEVAAQPPKEEGPAPRRYLLDTSAIIDGRIAGVCKTGFLEGILIVPRFVLNELQALSDSSDDLRRSKGRRGLELLNQMQQEGAVPIEVLDIEVSGASQVDDKLVALARQYRCPIITNDFNLNRVAGLQGVRVLSLNQLSDAVRPSVITGQIMYVMVHKEGRERQQGLSYLEDGTPVVIEDARKLIGQNVETVVTRVHQTPTGRIVFAELNTPHESKQTNQVEEVSGGKN
jgi:Integral membrane protein (PIN domain superfamily)